MRIDLNPASNYASPGVLEACGCRYDEVIENLAVDQAGQLFGADHVNVRTPSAAQANMAVYCANIEPGDTVLGVNYDGGLKNDNPRNMSGMSGNYIDYAVEALSGRINYENVFGLAFKHKPKLIITGSNPYPRRIDFVQLQEVAEEAGARLMVDMSSIAGLVAAGLHPSPVPYADFVTSTTAGTLRGPRGGLILCKRKFAALIDRAVADGIRSDSEPAAITAVAVALKEALSPQFRPYQEQAVKNAQALAAALAVRHFDLVTGGTDNHIIIIDLRNKNVTGREAEKRLSEAGLITAENAVPGDTGSAGAAGGIKVGTQAATSRGMKEEDMVIIADIINKVISHPKDGISLANARQMIADLCSRYPHGQDG